MNDLLELQRELDPTTRAQANPKIELPVAIKYNNSRRSIIISRGKEIEINEYDSIACSGYDELKKENVQQIPIADFIEELELLLYQARLAHGLTPDVWDFSDRVDIATGQL